MLKALEADFHIYKSRNFDRFEVGINVDFSRVINPKDLHLVMHFVKGLVCFIIVIPSTFCRLVNDVYK